MEKKFLLIMILIISFFGSHKTFAQKIYTHHFVISLNSSRIISAQNLRLADNNSVLVVDDSIRIDIDSIKSIFHDRPGNAAVETVTGTLIGTVTGLVLGVIASEIILGVSADPYYGNNAGGATVAGLVLLGGGIAAGTLIGHNLGADKLYDFTKMDHSKRLKVIEKLVKIKPN